MVLANPFDFPNDTLVIQKLDTSIKAFKEKDLKDIFQSVIKKKANTTNSIETKKYHFSLLPAAGYTLQTGTAGIISTNLAFYTYADSDAKISNISSSFTYSQYNQTIFLCMQISG